MMCCSQICSFGPRNGMMLLILNDLAGRYSRSQRSLTVEGCCIPKWHTDGRDGLIMALIFKHGMSVSLISFWSYIFRNDFFLIIESYDFFLIFPICSTYFVQILMTPSSTNPDSGPKRWANKNGPRNLRRLPMTSQFTYSKVPEMIEK